MKVQLLVSKPCSNRPKVRLAKVEGCTLFRRGLGWKHAGGECKTAGHNPDGCFDQTEVKAAQAEVVHAERAAITAQEAQRLAADFFEEDAEIKEAKVKEALGKEVEARAAEKTAKAKVAEAHKKAQAEAVKAAAKAREDFATRAAPAIASAIAANKGARAPVTVMVG